VQPGKTSSPNQGSGVKLTSLAFQLCQWPTRLHEVLCMTWMPGVRKVPCCASVPQPFRGQRCPERAPSEPEADHAPSPRVPRASMPGCCVPTDAPACHHLAERRKICVPVPSVRRPDLHVLPFFGDRRQSRSMSPNSLVRRATCEYHQTLSIARREVLDRPVDTVFPS